MDTSLLLARFWGILLIVAGIGLLNKKTLKAALKAKDNESFIFLTGFMALMFGALHVAAFNVWEMSYRGLITLLGWSTLVKGVIRFISPDFTQLSIRKFEKNAALFPAIFIVFLVIGVYLLYIGFM